MCQTPRCCIPRLTARQLQCHHSSSSGTVIQNCQETATAPPKRKSGGWQRSVQELYEKWGITPFSAINSKFMFQFPSEDKNSSCYLIKLNNIHYLSRYPCWKYCKNFLHHIYFTRQTRSWVVYRKSQDKYKSAYIHNGSMNPAKSEQSHCTLPLI